MILVFLVSAIGHEVVVGVPLHMLRGWAFWGIMLQVRAGLGGSGGRNTHSTAQHATVHNVRSGAPQRTACKAQWCVRADTAAARHTRLTHSHLYLLLMLLQVPLISLTEKLRQRLKSDTWGNYAFWLTFCIIGQPVCLLMYVHDYIYTHGGYRQLSSNIVGQATAAGAVAGLAGDYLRDA